MKPTFYLALIAVLVAALLDLRIALRGNDPLIADEVMAEGAAALRQHQKPGDVLVHSPLFSVTELSALGDLPARPDLPAPPIRESRRILLLDRVDQPMYGFGPPSEVIPLAEPLVLMIFKPKGDVPAPVFELISALDPTIMKVERPEGHVSAVCNHPRAEGGFDCPGEAEWLYLAPRTMRIGGGDRDCVWAHPTTGGVIVMTLPAPAVPAADRHLELTLEGGLTDDAVSGTPDGASVVIDIRQGSNSKGRLTVPNQLGFKKAAVRVDAEQPIELRITTARDGRRHHCLNATVAEIAGL